MLCHGSMVLRDGSAEPAQTGLLQIGPDGEPHSPPEPVPSDALLGALRESAMRGLPMLCANPDFQVTLPNGERGHMPGLIARLYEEQGGAVTYYGKPHDSVIKLPFYRRSPCDHPPLQKPTRLLKAACPPVPGGGPSLAAWMPKRGGGGALGRWRRSGARLKPPASLPLTVQARTGLRGLPRVARPGGGSIPGAHGGRLDRARCGGRQRGRHPLPIRGGRDPRRGGRPRRRR